jgi:hypothetical protein
MQFTGAKGITLFVAIIAIVCMAGFGSGILVGRQFPAHHYVQYGNTPYLLDSATGKVCDLGSLAGTKEAANPNGIPVADLLKSLNPSNPPPCPK